MAPRPNMGAEKLNFLRLFKTMIVECGGSMVLSTSPEH